MVGYNDWEKENFIPKTNTRKNRDKITKRKVDSDIECLWSVDDTSEYEDTSGFLDNLK